MTIDPFDDPFSTDRDAANFISAAEAGNVPLVTALLEKDPDAIRYVSDMGFTPLLHAVLAGRTAMVEFLLDRGAPIESRGENTGTTPLLLAAEMGHRDVVKLLMERGADTSVTDGTGRTLWMIAHMKDAGMAAFISGIEKDQRARQRQQEISDAVTALNEGLKEEMAPMRRLSFKTPASR